MAAPRLFLFFFLSITTLSLASVNINCGTSLSGVDNNNIKWVGDKDFVTSGESATVFSTTVEKSLTTLRYFPTGDSNCYNIPVTKGGKVLVRTMYYYGNYDGKFSTPSFSVIFEGKHRGTLSISSAFEPYVLELIFSPASGETSVCFVRTSTSSNPFVSSIEVLDLDDGMYSELGPNEGFFYQQRRAYGATQVLRSDPYGRFWLPSDQNILVTGIPSTAMFIDTSGASNKPPESVLLTSWTLEGLPLVDPTLPSGGVPVYLAMYFSDPVQSSGRSFNIFFGGKQVNRVPVVPLYGKTTQIVVRDVVANSATLLEFHSTISAISPPMINAAELYVISKGTSGGGSGSGSSGSGGGGGSGGSGGGESGSGSGGTSKGGSGGGNGVTSGGSSNGKSSNLPTIIGVVIAVAVSLVAVVCIAICLVKRSKKKPEPLTIPTSNIVANMGNGSSQPPPMNGEQISNDSNQPTNEVDMEEINDLIGVNHSYVVQSH